MTRLHISGIPNAVYSVDSSWKKMNVSLSRSAGSGRAAATPFDLYTEGHDLHEGRWFKADSSGNAVLDFVPAKDLDFEYEAELTVTAAAGGAAKSARVQVGLFNEISWGALADGELVWGDSNQNGLPDVKVDLSGGVAGEEVVIDGPGAEHVTVIPEKPVFDENGNVSFVIEQKPDAPADNTELNISAGDHSQTVIIVPSVFNPDVTVSPQNPGYGESFTVTITDAKPGSVIHFDPLGINGECVPSPSDVTVDRIGSASVEFSGITGYVEGGKISLDIEISASATGDETKVIHQEITIEEPGMDWEGLPPDGGSLVMGDSDGDGKGDLTLDLSGGIPGQTVEIGGADADKVTVTPSPAVFDDHGNLSVTIEEKDPADSGNLELTIGSGTDHRDITLVHGSYTVRITAPDTVDYGAENTVSVEVSGAKPGSEVSFLPVENVTSANPETVTADASGHAAAVYSGITDYKVTSLNLTVEYVADNDGTKALAQHTVSLREPELKLTADISEITDVTVPVEFILTGGKEGGKVEFEISGDGAFSPAPDTAFDAQGQARAVVSAVSPYEKAVKVTAKALERETESAEIPYNLPSKTIQIDYSGLTFKGQEKTIDYDTPFSIRLSGLTPGTVVILNRGNEGYGPAASQVTVNTAGEAVFEFAGVSDTSVDDFRIDGIYYRTSSPNSVTRWSTEPIHLYQYGTDSAMDFKLPDGAENQELTEFNTITVTITGGKPNAPIDFDIAQGSAEIVSADTQTDANGSATVTIKAKEPYHEGTGIIISAEHMGNHMESGEIPFRLSQTVDTGALSFAVSPEADKPFQIDYDTPYTVTVSGLIEGSTVTWNSNRNVRPDAAYSVADRNCTGEKENRTCSAVMSFSGITDYTLDRLSASTSAVSGHFAKNAAESAAPTADFTVPEITLKQYPLTVSHDGDALLTDEETMTFTVSGGKPGQAIEGVTLVPVTGELTAGISGAVSQELDDTGSMSFKTGLKSPYSGSFRATVTYMGGKSYESEVITAAPVAHEIRENNISISPTVDGSSDTIDYRTDYTVTVTADNGLIDGTEVIWDTVDSHGVRPESGTSTVKNGSASMKFAGIGDDHITEQTVQIHGTYYKTRGETARFEKTFRIKQYDMKLAVSGNPGKVDAGAEFTVNLTGSRNGETVVWSVTQGSADVTELKSDSRTDTSGAASATFRVNDHATEHDVQIHATVMGRDFSVNLPIVLNEYDTYMDLSSLSSLDYNTGFDVTVKQARKGTEPVVEVLGADGEIIESQSAKILTDYGDAELHFKGITKYGLTQITLRLTYMSDANTEVQKTSVISMKDYGLLKPVIEDGFTFAEGDSRTVTVSGGIYGAPVTWQSSSPYFVVSKEDSTFDRNGEARATVTASVPETVPETGDTLTGRITVSTTQQGGDSSSADVSVTLTDYGRTISLDIPDADYNTQLDVKVSGARPQTEISARLLHGTDVLGTAGAKVNDRGEAVITFSKDALKDFTLKDGLSLEYTYRKSASSQATGSQSVTLKEYSIELDPEKTWAMNEDDSQVITVSGGKEGASVTWNLSSPYFTLSNEKTVFDAAGEATATVLAHVDPTVSRDSLQTVLSVSSPLYGGLTDEKEISVNLTEYDPAVKLNGISELDYSMPFSLRVEEARPGTKVGIILSGNDGVKLDEKSADVQSDGTAVLDFAAVNSFELTGVTAELSFRSNAQTQGTPKEYSFSLKDYALSEITVQNGSVFTENQSKTVTVSGGKKGASVSWNVDGYFTLSDEQQVFDAQGRATALLTASVPDCNAQRGQLHGTLTVTSPLHGGLEKNAGIEVTLTEYSPSLTLPSYNSQAKTVDYATPFSITVSKARPGTEVTVTAGDETKKGDVQPDGTAEIAFSGITEWALTSVDVSAEYMKNAAEEGESPLKETLSLASYELSGLTVTGGNAFNEGDSRTVTVSGGKEGAPLEWQVKEGYFRLSDEQTVFDENGQATATLTTDIPAVLKSRSTSLADVLTVSTGLHGGSSDTENLTVALTVYSKTGSVELPSFRSQAGTIDFNAPYSLTFKGFRPDTTLEVAVKNGSSTLESKTLDVGPDGAVTGSFRAVTSYAISSDLTVEYTYYRTADETAVASETLKLYDYQLSQPVIESSEFTEGQNREIKITGGKEGVTVNWSSSSPYFKLSSTSSEFDSNGEAKVTVKAEIPDTVTTGTDTAFTGKITASTVLKGTKTGNAELSVKLNTYTPVAKLADPYNGIYADVSTHVTDKANTIDFNTPYSLTVDGLRPGTTVTVNSSRAVVPTAQSFDVSEDGTAVLSMKAIDEKDHADLNGKEVSVTYSYYDRANHVTTGTKVLKLVNYMITLESDKEVIIGNETFTLTASGGRPGSTVEWSIEGNGQLTANADSFGADGTAKATGVGIDPYTGAIIPSITGTISGSDKISLVSASRAKIEYSKLYFATGNGNSYGCFYEPLKGSTAPDLLVSVELGEFTVSDPSVIKSLRIKSDGFVNDSWAIALGKTEPETVVFGLPDSMMYDVYNIDTQVNTRITDNTFKIFLLVNLYYRSMSDSLWLDFSKGAPSAKASSIKEAMSSQCSANNASSKKFTDGFYGNQISVELIFR